MKRSGFKVMLKLVGLVKPLLGYMIVAILMGLIGHLFATFISVLGGFALLKALGMEVGLGLPMIFTLLGAFALFRGALRYVEQTCNHFIAFKLLALLRDKVFSALRTLAPAKLDGKQKGNLISVITADIELLEVFYAHTISPAFIGLIFSLIMVAFIGYYSWILAMLALIAYVTVGILIPITTSKMGGSRGREFREKSGELSAFVLDNLRGLGEILQYGQGNRRKEKMSQMTEELSKDEAELKATAGKNMAVTNMLLLLFDVAMVLLAGGLYGFKTAVIATLALMSSFGPLVSLAALGATLQNTFAAGNRVLDILEEEPLTEEITGKEAIPFRGAKAENITFAYDEELILSDFSLDVPKDKIVGIVGKSGSGKSTLLKLFMRFWRVREGKISLSERNVEEINTSDLRKMESFVTQETHLFHDSIKNNVRIAKLNATDEEIWEACKKASVHQFISKLPQGYDTPVGELGDTLSGGERQRIGMARAFLKDAPFMLLDEPTSNLDSLNEAVILKSLHREREGKTVVVISHRKSTMGVADVVYSVENGRMS